MTHWRSSEIKCIQIGTQNFPYGKCGEIEAKSFRRVRYSLMFFLNILSSRFVRRLKLCQHPRKDEFCTQLWCIRKHNEREIMFKFALRFKRVFPTFKYIYIEIHLWVGLTSFQYFASLGVMCSLPFPFYSVTFKHGTFLGEDFWEILLLND